MSDTDWKCDLCGRKQDGGEKPPQGWMLLVIPDRYTNLNEERVLCGYCVEVVRAPHLEQQRQMVEVPRECRPYVSEAKEFTDTEVDAIALLARIDQLTAKGAGQ